MSDRQSSSRVIEDDIREDRDTAPTAMETMRVRLAALEALERELSEFLENARD